MTNRDMFDQISNDELAIISSHNLSGERCKFCIHSERACWSCVNGIKAWLYAPCDNEPHAENNPPADNVNHPKHYTFGKIEVIDFIEDKKLGFHLGNAVKYISRAGRKDPAKTVEDLRKAAWYLNRQIERLERELDGQN